MALKLSLLLGVVCAVTAAPSRDLPILYQHSQPGHNVVVFRGANVELARQAGLLSGLPSLPTLGLAREGKSDDLGADSDSSAGDLSADSGLGSDSGADAGADLGVGVESDADSDADSGAGLNSDLGREGKSADADAAVAAVYATPAPPPPPPPPATYAPAPAPPRFTYKVVPQPVYRPAPVVYKPAPVVYKPAPVVYKPAPPPVYKPDPAPVYKPAPAYKEPAYADVDAKYNWEYAVLDAPANNNFGHKESRTASLTNGVYYVALPDGRLQTVTYVVDGYGGYVPVVEYSGEAQYPPEPAPYKPAPLPTYSA